MNLWLLALFLQTSTITGKLELRISDVNGGAIVNARATLREKSSGTTRTLPPSDAQGQTRAVAVPSGDYALRIEADGFTPVAVEELRISIGQTVVQRITMPLATFAQRLDVQEQADSLQTSATTANVALGGERIEEAPTQNRNYLNFVLSAPGVASSPRANTSRSPAGLRNPANDSGFVFAGMRGRNNSISIDGVDNRDETTGANRVAIGLEIVQEFRVAGTSVGAEFGGAAGGLVNVVTRSGENVWHGDFTFFTQNENLNARNPEIETSGRPRFRRYQPGASIGGPIRRDRTFFFAAYEHSRESSQEWSEAPALKNPNWFRGLFDTGETDHLFALKASHQLSSTNLFSARYALSRGRVRNDVQSVENFTDRSARGSSLLADHSFVGGWSATIQSTFLNDLRFQLSQRSAELTPNSSNPMIEIPGVVTFGQSYRLDQARQERHAEVVESIQWSRGRHTAAAGANLHGVFFDGRLANRFRGISIYPTLADFLVGRPDVTIQSFGNPRTGINTAPFGLWLQEHWQLTPSLSIDAGLRYDHQWLPTALGITTNNISPRLGFAWHPSASSSWVFRAGTGLFYDRYPLEFLNDAIQKDGIRGYELFNGVRATYQIAPGFASTYSRKLTAGVERKLDRDTTLTVEFSDVTGLHLPRIRNAALRLPPVYHLENTARSRYQGAAFSVNRRLRNELTYLLHYNLGTTHDDASDFDEHPLDPANLKLDWARSRQHQRHRIAISGLYEPPLDELLSFLPEWLQTVLDNWTFAPVFAWGSGRPLNVLLTTDSYGTGAYPISARPAGFGRNSAYSPKTVSFDLRLMKTILVKDGRARLQFGIDGFNLMNHTNRLRVSSYYTPSFGGTIEVQNPRQLQLMIQFEY